MHSRGHEIASFTEDLIEAGLVVPSSVSGVWERGAELERVVAALDALFASEAKAQGSEERFFPPVLPSEVVFRAGYLEKFPHLCGFIYAFDGSESDHSGLLAAAEGEASWLKYMASTSLCLCPAACYPLYPALAGALPSGGRKVTLSSYIFRHEPSLDPARLQVFRMREDVRLGNSEQVTEWRLAWLKRSVSLIEQLGLEPKVENATDPFFGRARKFLAHSQRAQALKFEIVVPIDDETPTAVASFNYHQDHFASCFGITLDHGGPAESACIGFGLERIALALLRKHGLHPRSWPTQVRTLLW